MRNLTGKAQYGALGIQPHSLPRSKGVKAVVFANLMMRMLLKTARAAAQGEEGNERQDGMAGDPAPRSATHQNTGRSSSVMAP